MQYDNSVIIPFLIWGEPVPTDGLPTRQAILQSAMQAFLTHGFDGAHLRGIAADAGVTTGALYRHFKDKKALFEALVNPVRADVTRRFVEQTDEYIRLLETQGMAPMWNQSGWGANRLVEYIYDRFDEFKLLLVCAPQEVSEEFIHTLIELEIQSTLRYLQAGKERGLSVNIPAAQELHMIVNAQFSSYFELVLHDIPREQGIEYAESLTRFFVAGWKAVILE